MKTIKLLFVSSLLSFGCDSSYDYAFEDKLLDCFYDQYAVYGIDIKASIDSAEHVLMENNIVQTSQSYYDILVEMKATDNIPFSSTDELKAELENIKYLPSRIQCSDTSYISYDSAVINNSKLGSLLSVFDSIAAKGNISPSIVAGELLNILEPEDFSHELYHHFGTLLVANFLKFNFNSKLGLLPETSRINNYDYDTLTILLTAKDSLYIEDKVVDTKAAKSIMAKFIVEKNKKHLIIFKSYRNTRQRAFIETLDLIQNAYNDVQSEHEDIPYNFHVSDPIYP